MKLKFPSKYKVWDITIALRYLPAVNFLKRNSIDEDNFLEVGSGSLGICPYLARKVTGVDISFDEITHPLLLPVKATGSKIPFKNNSFNFVLSMDTLEHLPYGRKKMIYEILRVAKKGVIIGFPVGFWSKLVDSFLDWYYQKTHGEKLDFLVEHRKYSLPKTKEMEESIRNSARKLNKKISVQVKNNTNVFLLVFLLILGFSQKKLLCRFYRYLLVLTPFLVHLNFYPCYRKIFYIKIED